MGSLNAAKPRDALSNSNLLFLIAAVIFVLMYGFAILRYPGSFLQFQTFFDLCHWRIVCGLYSLLRQEAGYQGRDQGADVEGIRPINQGCGMGPGGPCYYPGRDLFRIVYTH